MSTLAPKWQRPEILEAVFDQLSDALFLYDKDLNVVGVNQAAQRLFGMSSQEMIGKQCQELFRCTACEPGCGILRGLERPDQRALRSPMMSGHGHGALLVTRD